MKNKKNDDVLSRRQPNSEAREEFLIVIEYLLTEAYDEEHATTQSKILQYALNKYNVIIRRDRVNQILIHLYQLSEKYQDKFPFKLQVKKINKIFKFYVGQRMFSDQEILDIVSSIVNDDRKSDALSKSLVDKFLTIAANEHKKRSLEKSIKKVNRRKKRMNNAAIIQFQALEDAMLNKKRVWVSFKSIHDVDFSSYKKSQKERYKEEENLTGFVYHIMEMDEDTLVVLYFDDEKNVAIAKIDNIILAREPLDIGEWANDVTYEFKDRKYATIEAWVDAHYKGQDGFTRDITIKTAIVTKERFEKFKKNFEAYWKIPMEYTTKERTVTQVYFDRDGNRVEEEMVVNDAYITFESNLPSFRHWYMDYEIFSRVVIVDPAYLNDRFMSTLAERLMNRITKYGGIYNYKFEKSYKPEYEEQMKERQAQLERFKKEREKKENEGDDK